VYVAISVLWILGGGKYWTAVQYLLLFTIFEVLEGSMHAEIFVGAIITMAQYLAPLWHLIVCSSMMRVVDPVSFALP
jgi:hypothetical protein